MAEITAALVKDLRQKSGAGMMDCKKALSENDGNIEAAMDWLKAKGLSKAAKKADRVAAEGLVAVASKSDGNGMSAVVVELNSETDFVARNNIFQSNLKNIAHAALNVDGGVDAVSGANVDGGKTVDETVKDMIATIGENMNLRRVDRLSVGSGAVASYIHNSVAPDLGKIGVLVALKGEGDQTAMLDAGKKVAMHVAATRPLALSSDELDQDVIEREKAIFTEQARESGKPEGVIEKMIEGRLRKFMEEVVLSKQAFVVDPDHTVEGFIEKEFGGKVKLSGFVRMELGEGVEKKEEDFAAEVAAASGQVTA